MKAIICDKCKKVIKNQYFEMLLRDAPKLTQKLSIFMPNISPRIIHHFCSLKCINGFYDSKINYKPKYVITHEKIIGRTK